jgi:F-type H+-transporting ATPase subunit b
MAQAEAEAAKAREAALAEAAQGATGCWQMCGQIASLAIAAARRLIGDTLDERRQNAHRRVLHRHQVRQSHRPGRRRSVGCFGGELCALPLIPEEQEIVRRDILSRIGSQATVTFRVDPSILGGLIFRVGDKVIDMSVSGQLESLHQGLR